MDPEWKSSLVGSLNGIPDLSLLQSILDMIPAIEIKKVLSPDL